MERLQFLCCNHTLITATLSIYLLTLCLHGAYSCNQHATDCVEGQTFLNSSGCCEPCRSCDLGRMYNKTKCNVTHNTQCECLSPQYYHSYYKRCEINCEKCPDTMMCNGRGGCKCKNDCFADDDTFCEGIGRKCSSLLPVDTNNEVTEIKNRPPNVPETFPAWGIGLVAIGVVIGIIVFASCFLGLGLVTVSRRRDPESQGSETSESGLVRSSFSSIGTESSFLSTGYPYLTSHSMLELLKNSNPQLLTPAGSSSLGSEGPVSNSQRSSPINSRDSPRPVRTIKLVKHSDKLSAVVL